MGMNLLTGVFVDQAMRVVREDKDLVMAKRIADLFIDPKEANPKELTWNDFEEKLDTPVMKEYFIQINVDILEAKSFFDLLDADGSGGVDAREIVDGCLKVRGPARALELSMLAKDFSDLRQMMTELTKA